MNEKRSWRYFLAAFLGVGLGCLMIGVFCVLVDDAWGAFSAALSGGLCLGVLFVNRISIRWRDEALHARNEMIDNLLESLADQRTKRRARKKYTCMGVSTQERGGVMTLEEIIKRVRHYKELALDPPHEE